IWSAFGGLLEPLISEVSWVQFPSPLLDNPGNSGGFFIFKSLFLLCVFQKIPLLPLSSAKWKASPFEQVIEHIWPNRDRHYHVKCLVRRLQRIDKEMSADARCSRRRAALMVTWASTRSG